MQCDPEHGAGWKRLTGWGSARRGEVRRRSGEGPGHRLREVHVGRPERPARSPSACSYLDPDCACAGTLVDWAKTCLNLTIKTV